MRWPVVLLLVLLVVLQYPLWVGRGGWLHVWKIDKNLQAQRAHNQQLEQRNARLDAEVSDLQTGSEAIEEHARYDLGLVRPGEIFVQTPAAVAAEPVPASPVATTPAERSDGSPQQWPQSSPSPEP